MGELNDISYVVKDAWSTSGTRVFSENMHRFYIDNMGGSNISFTINGITIDVKPSESFENSFEPFNKVTISNNSTFIANVSKIKSGSTNPQYVVKDSYNGFVNTTRQFSSPAQGVIISNDGVSYITYSLNGITSTVRAGEVIERDFEDFTEISINATSEFRTCIKGNYTGIPIDTDPPENVTGLTASNIADASLTLSWNPSISSDIESYDIYEGATFIANVATTTYEISGLVPSTLYTFTIEAKDIFGNVASGTSINATTSSQVYEHILDGLVNKWDNVSTQITLSNDGTYFPSTDEFTVVATFKPKAFINIISQFNVSSPSVSTFRLNLESTGKRPSISSWGTQTGGTSAFSSTTSSSEVLLNANEYYHVVVTRNNTAQRFYIYVNDIQIAFTSIFSSGYALNNNVTPPAENIKIGHLGADIKNILYYNRRLTAEEMTQNYNALSS
jgi:hypothetical protein